MITAALIFLILLSVVAAIGAITTDGEPGAGCITIIVAMVGVGLAITGICVLYSKY